MKKYNKLFLFIVLSLVFTITGCTQASTENDISEDVQKIIETFMTAPNPDLYSPEMTTYVGLDAEPTEEEKAATKAKSEEITANWEATLGDCFDENGVTTFLNSGPALYYLVREQEVEVVNMELVDKVYSYEIVQVTAQIDGAEEEVQLLFKRNPNGKIWFVEFYE